MAFNWKQAREAWQTTYGKKALSFTDVSDEYPDQSPLKGVLITEIGATDSFVSFVDLDKKTILQRITSEKFEILFSNLTDTINSNEIDFLYALACVYGVENSSEDPTQHPNLTFEKEKFNSLLFWVEKQQKLAPTP